MAILFKEHYQIPEELLVLQDVYPLNLFDESFGIWPDNLVVFKNSQLVLRGIMNLDGTRDYNHTQDLINNLQSLRYQS